MEHGVGGDLNLNSVFEHTSLCKFKRRFELQSVCNDFKFVNINVKTLPFIYGLNLEQYDADVILNKLNFHLKIVCSTHLYNGFIRSLKIKIYNLNKQKEIAGCTNFLQRQKNLHLALNVLRKCSKLFEERKIVLQTVADGFKELFNVEKSDDLGYVITSLDKRKNFLFFESNWSIGWNFRNYNVFDFVDFMLNSRDEVFNVKAKPIMKTLTNPHNSINCKLKLWKEMLHCVQLAVNNKTFRVELCPAVGALTQATVDVGSRKRYKNLLDNKDFYLIHPEVIEIDSDDEVCMEVENCDNDVEVVSAKGLRHNSGVEPVCQENGTIHLRRSKRTQSSIVIDDVLD